MRLPWIPLSPAMRCPACSGSESMFVKWAYSWHGAGASLVKKIVGACVVCLRCDEPYVVTPAGSFRKKRAAAVPPHRRAAAADADLEKLVAAVNAMPDEPQ